MYHGDADEDDVGEVGEHDGQEHKVAELLAEARPLKKRQNVAYLQSRQIRA